MPKSHHLVLHWNTATLHGLPFPSADILVGRCTIDDKEGRHFGSDCRTKQDIDEVVDDLIRDLNFARTAAHRRFDKHDKLRRKWESTKRKGNP